MTDAAIQRAPAAPRPTAPKPRPRAPWQVWRDTAGRLSWLRIGVLVLLFVPWGIATYDFNFNLEAVGARPLNNVIHRTGFWTLVFLLLTLAITPLRRIGRFNQLVDVRRMVGVGAFVYAACHITLYMADQMFDLWKVVSEIALRFYLTVGFTALLGLAALAVTSTDGMVRRLGGKRWQRLHNIIYGIGALALFHYFQQTKADELVPTLVAGMFAWMIGYRLLIKFRKTRDEPPSWMLLALTVVVAALTLVGEAVGLSIVFHAPLMRVLQSTLDVDFTDISSFRPGWLLLGAGLIVVAVDLVRARYGRRKPTRPIAARSPPPP